MLDHLWQTELLNLYMKIPMNKFDMILRLNKILTFPVMKISVYFLWGNKQVNHLPEGIFEIHLLEVAKLSYEFVSFCSS